MDISYGSMGSEVSVLRFPPASFAEAAGIDWSATARRVFIDSVSGLIALMSPSSAHEIHAQGSGDLVKEIGKAYGIRTVGLGSTRWKTPGDPQKGAAEPDACYYLGEKAEAWDDAYAAGEAAREAFEAAHPPDLVIEVERSHGDAGKPAFYRALGVPEMWRLDIGRDRRLEAEIIDLQAEDAPELLTGSFVLPLCTPSFVAGAVAVASRGRFAELDALIAEAREADASREAPGPGF